MKDYQAVSRDRAFIQESLRTLKKRHEELLSKLHQSEVGIVFFIQCAIQDFLTLKSHPLISVANGFSVYTCMHTCNPRLK